MNQFAWTPTNPPPVPVPPPLPATPQFTGNRKGFFNLVARGAGLELVTLGFYRFWLLTDIRRHLWSNTVIDGDAAEYTGRGRELLIGFLIAMAILMPIYLGYFLIGIEAERWQALASFPLIAAFYVFGQFAIYRARRYRLTRTVWRGVRFWMTGSGWAYAGARRCGACSRSSRSALPCRGGRLRSSATRCGIPGTAICRASSRGGAGSSSSASGGCGW